MITIKREWDNNQLNAFYFSSFVLLFDLIHDSEKIKHIFELGGLSFVPSNSQINNWRKTKKSSPIFYDEYLKCFLAGLIKLKNITDVNLDTFNRYNKVSFVYELLVKLLNIDDEIKNNQLKKENANINDFENLVNWLDGFRVNNSELFFI